MVIESDSITKEYAKEYLSIAAMSKKLIKDPAHLWGQAPDSDSYKSLMKKVMK